MPKYSDYDDDGVDPLWVYEQELEQRDARERDRLRALTPENLGKEWERQCNRHDSAVDRCEDLNSSTIEDAQRWMNFIERVFKEKGLNSHDYIFNDAE